jgi:type IV pilus assembly protein PilB
MIGTMRFGEWLIQKAWIDESILEEALELQKTEKKRLGQILVSMDIISSVECAQLLSEFFDVPYFGPEHFDDIEMDVAWKLNELVAQRYSLIAVSESEDKRVVQVAMTDPLNVLTIDTISAKLRASLEVMIIAEEEIARAIDVIYHGKDLAERELRDIVELEVETGDYEEEEEEVQEAEASRAPVIRFVDLMLNQAVQTGASDIHVEPQESNMDIRMRVDGQLMKMVPPSRKMQAAVTTRLKILSQMDIAERRLPQDGRFKLRAGSKAVDVRVNSLPTIYGEKIVMRILDSSTIPNNINGVGFEPKYLTIFKKILQQPHGIIVVTGPTGSGKSTTLYSALNYLKDPRKNITTVEDPVEYRLGGINQVQVRSDIGLTFASSLRAILRQDPDIVLLGEIRDRETMDIAMKAAMTGHLVLSTFHTNDAPSAISRFVFMGLEPYLLASTLNLVLAQRLVRRICDYCKRPVELDETAKKWLKLPEETIRNTTFYEGVGCPLCNDRGYAGRFPIFEFLVVDNEIRRQIIAKASELEVREAARRKGYGGLMDCGIQALLDGKTSVEELMSVVYTDEV